ncbi:hypothetical protein EMIT019CA3_300013 [Bacillus pseudomycoides]
MKRYGTIMIFGNHRHTTKTTFSLLSLFYKWYLLLKHQLGSFLYILLYLKYKRSLMLITISKKVSKKKQIIVYFFIIYLLLQNRLMAKTLLDVDLSNRSTIISSTLYIQSLF